jgi:uncharacterized membrane protein
MHKGRTEAFSDGVIAIIITIMVLELKVPHEATLEAVFKLLPIFLSYVLSFLYVGIYWVNHHHLFQVTKRVNSQVMWANIHLLFWLSLIPFTTGWMGENNFANLPTMLYGINLILAAFAYIILQIQILRIHGADSALAKAIGTDFKGRLSLGIYLVAIVLAFWLPWVSGLLYGIVSLIWFIPDYRLEQALENSKDNEPTTKS